MRPPLLVVEPHPDDCVVSTLHAISTYDCDVLTVVNPRLDTQDTDRRCSVEVQTHHPGHRIQNVIELNFPDYNWYQRVKKFSNTSMLEAHYHFTYAKTAQLQSTLEAILPHYKSVLAPVGIEHPMHMLVAELCRPYAKAFYVDMPYAWNKFGVQMMAEQFVRQSLFALKESSVQTSWDEKERILKKAYKLPYWEICNFKKVNPGLEIYYNL